MSKSKLFTILSIVILVAAAMAFGYYHLDKPQAEEKANPANVKKETKQVNQKTVDTNPMIEGGVPDLATWYRYATDGKHPWMKESFDELHPGKWSVLEKTVKSGKDYRLTLKKKAVIANSWYNPRTKTWGIKHNYVAAPGTVFLKLSDGTVVVKAFCGNVVRFPDKPVPKKPNPKPSTAKAPKNSSPLTTPLSPKNPFTNKKDEGLDPKKTAPTECYVPGNGERTIEKEESRPKYEGGQTDLDTSDKSNPVVEAPPPRHREPAKLPIEQPDISGTVPDPN